MLPLTPTKLGRYEIVDEIGKGAMGVVYLARDPLIGRQVALKTFRIGYSVKDQELEQFRIRFMREAQSAGILTHPNIVTIHDVVEQSEDGLAFIAMEYVRGTNLKLLLQGEHSLPLPFVLDIVAQVGEALDYAHANKVIHRDVKPANILITPENRVKITDFGIARLESSNLTQEGQLLGTPNYMAPEQIQGKEVDHRADLFSLGVVLYEMLTRHKPFQGENLTVVSHRIVYDHFTPPREYVRDLPPGLEPVLARALDKDPTRRFQRARDMVDELRRVVESSVRGADLNETQSLSATLVLPAAPPPLPPGAAGAPAPAAEKPSVFSRWRKKAAPPPPPPLADPGTGTGSRSGTGTSGTASGPAVPPGAIAEASTLATQAPVLPPPPPPRRKSTRRSLLASGLIGLLLAAPVAGFLAYQAGDLRRQADGYAGRDAAQDQRQREIFRLAAEGQAHMQNAHYDAALASYDQALRLAPNSRGLQQRRALVAAKQAEYLQMVGRDLEIAKRLDEARRALNERRYAAAMVEAGAVLRASPENYGPQAEEIINLAQQGLQSGQRPAPVPRRGERPGETVATLPEPSDSAPATSEAEPARGETMAALNIHFKSDFPEDGSVIIYINGKEEHRERFQDGKGGLLRGRREQQRLEFNKTLPVPAGFVDVRVQVAAGRRKADVVSRDGLFSGGSSRSLDIRYGGPDQLSVTLR